MGEMVIDLAAFRVTRNGRNIRLGPTEYRLFKFLMEHPNCNLSREEIIDEIWARAPPWTLARWTSTFSACVTPLLKKVSRT